MIRKLTILGGASLNTPSFIEACSTHKLEIEQLCLFDIEVKRLDLIEKFCSNLVAYHKLSTEIKGTNDIIEAVADADYILFMIRAGGEYSEHKDSKNLAFSGILGHAGFYTKAFRNAKPVLEYSKAIEKASPLSTLIIFSNPVSLLCEMIRRNTSLHPIGLCYHSYHLKEKIAAITEKNEADLFVNTIGINHVSFICDCLYQGKSIMKEFLEQINNAQSNFFNYPLTKYIDVIPILEAFSLFYKGERFHWSQDGKRSFLRQLKAKYLPYSFIKAKLNTILKEIKNNNFNIISSLRNRALWYDKTIVPFLRDFSSKKEKDYIITFENISPLFDRKTIETVFSFKEGLLTQKNPNIQCPEYVYSLLSQVMISEQLMIEAIVTNSKEKALESLIVHPNVKSAIKARELLKKYF
jgi:alpha-galactosidase/6-phospho-beta-glucosidase family protein